MSILHTLGRLASQYRAHRLRLSTYAEIANLPPEIRKDIGWPVADGEGPRRTVHRP